MLDFIKGLGVIAVILIILALVVFGPLVTIWALNTLFPALAIPYTFWTWLAMCVINMTLAARTFRSD